MKLHQNMGVSSWFQYIFTLVICIGIIIFSNKKVRELKAEESEKVANYAHTLELLSTESDIPSEIQAFLVDLIAQNTTIPVILVDEKGQYLDSKNVELKIVSNPNNLKRELQKMSEMYKPIPVMLPFGKQYIYYKNSVLLTQLGYYPIILIISVLLYIWFTFWYFRVLRKTEQSLLWAGMAKETAHQLGTPLSSIIGWIEILKIEDIDQNPVNHIEKDVHRLMTITDRFSKIGSTAILKEEDVVDVLSHSVRYLENRISRQIKIVVELPKEPIIMQINAPLFSWVVENLIKNAIDAMKNQGSITIRLTDIGKKIYLDISDEGSGISAQNKRKVFKPGFTTKKRGWGLGLSLVKRIVEDYHYGKIFILNSEVNKGTTFRIILKKYRKS